MISYRVGCYGKLPFQGDFIRHDAHVPEVTLLDRWLQEGLVRAGEVLGEGFNDVYRTATPIRFCFAPPNSKHVILGVLRSGHDRTHRRFPFMILTCTDAKEVRKNPALAPLLFRNFLDRAFALVGTASYSPSLATLQAQVSALSGSVDVKAADKELSAALDAAANPMLDRMLGSVGDERRLILLWNAASLLGPLSEPRFVLRLPVRGGPQDVSLWLAALEIMNGRERSPVLATWNDQQLHLVLGDAAPSHYLPLFLTDVTSEDACALADEGFPGLVPTARDKVGELVDDAGLSAAKLFKRLSKLG